MHKQLKNKKGSALAIVLIVMAVLSVLGTAALGTAVAETKFTSRQENKIKAYYIARSGAQAIAEYMIKDSNNDAHDFIGKESDWNTQIGGGKFKVTVSDDVANKVVNIVSVGEYNSIQQQAKIKVTRSLDGVGGIFKHAIVAKQDITLSSGNGNKTKIEGTVATKDGETNIGSATISGGAPIKDPNLIFPPIVLPPDRTPAIAYNLNLGDIVVNQIVPHINSSSVSPIYVSTGSISRKNNTIEVTGNGIVHMYVNGNIDLDTNSQFNVNTNAKLYIYVVGNRTVKLIGNGAQNNIFLYAPDSHIEWNNAQPSNDFFGAIIGKSIALHNQLSIRYNPDMVNEVELDTTGVGTTFTGYAWID